MPETFSWLPTVLRTEAKEVTNRIEVRVVTAALLCYDLFLTTPLLLIYPSHTRLLVSLWATEQLFPLSETLYTKFPHDPFRFLFRFYHLNKAYPDHVI